ncbi:MAG: nicotinate-nicotinamide nucleotide adenylyltransferase [Candidatus Dormibacteria bacterium]
MTGQPLVVFGGTFDPPHLGHQQVIVGLRGTLGLPLLVVPNGHPVHRRPPSASPEDRLRMAQLMVQEVGDPLVSVSDLEVGRPGPSYTSDTLARLVDGEPGRPLLLALGSDAARSLWRWHRPDLVAERARLVVFDRPGSRIGAGAAVEELKGHGWPGPEPLLVSLTAPEVESSRVRARLRRGEVAEGLLAASVLRHIRERGLYRESAQSAAVPDGIIAPR